MLALTTNQLVRSGRQPKLLGSRYTMPHRLTVAGDATARSPTTKIMDILEDMAMISLLGRHSFLLSSRTVFMFCSRQQKDRMTNDHQREQG